MGYAGEFFAIFYIYFFFLHQKWKRWVTNQDGEAASAVK